MVRVWERVHVLARTMCVLVLLCSSTLAVEGLQWNCGFVSEVENAAARSVRHTVAPGETGFMRCSVAALDSTVGVANEQGVMEELIIRGICPYLRSERLEYLSQWDHNALFRKGVDFFFPFRAPSFEVVLRYEVSTTLDGFGAVLDYANQTTEQQHKIDSSHRRVSVTQVDTGNNPLDYYDGIAKLANAQTKDSLIMVGEIGVQAVVSEVVVSLAAAVVPPAGQPYVFVEEMKTGGARVKVLRSGTSHGGLELSEATTAMVINEDAAYLLFVSNERERDGTVQLAELESSVVASSSKACGYVVHSAVAMNTGLLLTTNRGVFLTGGDGGNGTAVHAVLESKDISCVDALHIHESPSAMHVVLMEATSLRTFHVSIQAHANTSSTTHVRELLDMNNGTLREAMADDWGKAPFVVGVAMIDVAAGAPIVLVHTGHRKSSGKSRFELYWLRFEGNASMPTWSRRSSLPLYVNRSAHVDGGRRSSLAGGDGADAVDITGMEVSDTQIFVYGSVLLCSTDFGASWLLLHAFHPAVDGEVAAFAVRSDQASYVLITSKGQVWFGVSAGLTTRLGVVEKQLNMNKFVYQLGSTASNELRAMGVKKGSTCKAINASPDACLWLSSGLDADIASATAAHAAQGLKYAKCPYASVEVNSTDNVRVTREHWQFDDAELERVTLPSPVYLDFQQTYNFSLRVTVHSEFRNESDAFLQALVAFHLVGSSVRLTKHANVQRDALGTHVLFVVTISDATGRTPSTQFAPGLGLTSSILTISLRDPSWACGRDSPLGGGSTALSASDALARGFRVIFHVGCAVKQQLYFDAIASRYFIDHCNVQEEDGHPCLSYSFVLEPKLFLRDHVSDSEVPYDSEFTFTVLGGSQDPNAIKTYTQEEFDSFNLGRKTIWLVENAEPNNVLTNRSIISWVCGVGSPCSGVVPVFGDTPSYYMKIRVSTGGANMRTYCDYSTEFVLRLHGLQMDYITVMVISSVSVLCLGMIVLIIYLFLRPRYREHHTRVEQLLKEALAKESATRFGRVASRSKFTGDVSMMDSMGDIPDEELLSSEKEEEEEHKGGEPERGGVEMVTVARK